MCIHSYYFLLLLSLSFLLWTNGQTTYTKEKLDNNPGLYYKQMDPIRIKRNKVISHLEGQVRDVISKIESESRQWDYIMRLYSNERALEARLDHGIVGSSKLLEILRKLKEGGVHPDLLSVDMIHHIINDIKHISNDLEIPTPTQYSRIEEIARISKVDAIHHQGRTHIDLHLPLVDRNPYNLSRYQYLALNSDQEQYIRNHHSAASIKKSTSGFPFPPHLIGTNYTAMDDLQLYKEKYNPVDLGIDLLDDDTPEYIRKALAEATLADPAYNQYTAYDGTLRLRTAIADLYSPLVGQQLNPMENVMVTVGATEAMHSAIVGHTFIDDEWILIEPAYIIYLPMIKMARGIPRFTALKLKKHEGSVNGNDWELDKEEFEGLFNEKTKGIILNNPVNPIGKVFTLEELQFIATLAQKHDVLVISDEVHEWVAHNPHYRIAALPGMYERTITVGSASKSFSVAGWRIGWAYGHKDVLSHVKTVHMNTVDSAPAPQQEAIAFAFEEEIRNFGSPNSYFATHREYVKRHRDMLIEVFTDVGLEPVVTSGGFCMLVNWTPIKSKIPWIAKSMDFVMWLIKDIGVLGLPGTSYFGKKHKHIGQDYARFCYHKKVDTLEEAVRRLRKLKDL